MHPLRYRPSHDVVLFITNRTVEGLPIGVQPIMKETVLGCLGRAQQLHPVDISHFLFMPNHFHFILAGSCKNTSKFMRYFQTELARAIKKLTKIFKYIVWKSRYSEQQILTAEMLIDKIVYIYENPVKAGLVDEAIKWEGASSLRMYKSGTTEIDTTWIPSRYYKALPECLTAREGLDYLKELRKKKGCEKSRLRMNFNLCFKCLEESRTWTDEEIYSRIFKRIAFEDKKYQELHKNSFLGVEKLRKRSINMEYYPSKKGGRQPLFMSDDNEKRIEKINELKELKIQKEIAYKEWRQGITTAPYPRGLFRPGMPVLGVLRTSNKTLKNQRRKERKRAKVEAYSMKRQILETIRSNVVEKTENVFSEIVSKVASSLQVNGLKFA